MLHVTFSHAKAPKEVYTSSDDKAAKRDQQSKPAMHDKSDLIVVQCSETGLLRHATLADKADLRYYYYRSDSTQTFTESCCLC